MIIVEAWLKKADHDLYAAKLLMDDGEVLGYSGFSYSTSGRKTFKILF